MSLSEYSHLYGDFANCYDLHTSPVHYQHDHTFVLQQAALIKGQNRILDIGCGTGVFLEKALAAGMNPIGLDPAPGMLACAKGRVGDKRVRLARMQDLADVNAFECIVALSWSLNYCKDQDELRDVLQRFYRALSHGGSMVLQVAHAAHAAVRPPDFFEDREPGPGGPEDIVFQYRFWQGGTRMMKAEYRFHCLSTEKRFEEVHTLTVADANLIAQTAGEEGFTDVTILENCHSEPFTISISPFVLARK